MLLRVIRLNVDESRVSLFCKITHIFNAMYCTFKYRVFSYYTVNVHQINTSESTFELSDFLLLVVPFKFAA